MSKVDALELGSVKVPGVPVGINPKIFLPFIVKTISDEMLEQAADFLLMVADDIKKIRAVKLLIADETLENTTELRKI